MRQHHHQLDADEQHADAHARLERDGVDRVGLAPQAGEGGARVGEGVDPDAEPGHAVAAGDADQREQQDHRAPFAGSKCRQDAEVDDDDGADEHLEQQDELALGDEVGLAGLVDQLGDLLHRLVHGQVLELLVDDQAEGQARRQTRMPTSSSRSPGIRRGRRREPRSGRTRLASPPGLCSAGAKAAGSPSEGKAARAASAAASCARILMARAIRSEAPPEVTLLAAAACASSRGAALTAARRGRSVGARRSAGAGWRGRYSSRS